MVAEENGVVSGVYPEAMQQIEKNTTCRFIYLPMPRARALRQFEIGEEIDMLPATVRTAARDQIGEFVPVSSGPVVLITLKQGIGDPLAALRKRSLLVNGVRGFDYGPRYQELIAQLKQMDRYEEVRDPQTAARKLIAGRADAVIIAAPVFYSAAAEYKLLDNLVATVVPEIPVVTGGIYLSKMRLTPEDRKLLAGQIRALVDKRVFWRLTEEKHHNAPWVTSGYKLESSTSLSKKSAK